MEASTSGPLEIFDPEHENTQLQKTTSTIHPKYDVGATLVTRIRKHLYAALQVSTKDWSQIFDQYDLNGDGEISMKEFRAALRGPSANLSEKILPDNTLRALFNTIDVDNSGGIDSLEFLTWLQEERSEIETGNGETDEISWNVGLSSMALPGVEDSWDLSSPTSPRPKRSPPLTPSSSFIKPIRGYKQPDFLSKSASPHSKRFQQVENMKSKPPQDEFLRNKLRAAAYDFGGINFRKLFRHQDRDNSGSLSYDEFKRAIRKDGKMSNSILSDHDLNTLFHQIDIDNGGEIEIDEFIRWLKKPGDKVIDRSGENIRKTNEKKRQQHSAGMVNQPHENVNQQLDLPHEQRLLPPPKWDYYSPPPPLPPPPAHDFLAAPISPRSPPMALKVGGHHALLLQNVDNMLNEINLYEKKGVTFRKSRQSPTNLIKHKRPPSSLVNMTPRQERRLAAALDHMGVFSRSGAEDLFQMLNKYANSRDLIDHYGFSLSLRSNFNKQHAKTSTATLKNRTIDSLWFLLDSKRSGKINVVEFQQWMWNRLQKNITYGTESSHVKIKKKSQSKKKNSIQQMYEEQRNVRAASPSKHLNRRPNWRWCESPSSPCNAGKTFHQILFFTILITRMIVVQFY
jgi:Ca2+-binding EF-hand superfamily protein